LEEHPTLIGDLLQSIASKIDHTQVVTLVRELGHLPLIKAYLTNVQEANVHAVNEALNALYIEEEDYETLHHSIETYKNFDALELARKLEKHELIEFRRIAAVLYKQNGKFAKSIDLCKENKLFQDAAKCAADSDDVEVAEVCPLYHLIRWTGLALPNWMLCPFSIELAQILCGAKEPTGFRRLLVHLLPLASSRRSLGVGLEKQDDWLCYAIHYSNNERI